MSIPAATSSSGHSMRMLHHTLHGSAPVVLARRMRPTVMTVRPDINRFAATSPVPSPEDDGDADDDQDHRPPLADVHARDELLRQEDQPQHDEDDPADETSAAV